MSNLPKEPHPLAVIAAEVVRRMQDKPGTWDFQQAFQLYFDKEELIKLLERADENKIAQNEVAAHLGKQLYLFNRGLELQRAIRVLKDRIGIE